MLPADVRVGVAVSGGRDSIALLDVLGMLAPEFRIECVVLHLNHRLRGTESDDDERFVRDVAAQRGLRFLSRAVDLGQASGNLEQAARQARHQFFAEAMRECQLARVATGHTRSDQAETVLFRFLRGAANTGMAGILPITREGLIRPLLECSREEVARFADSRQLAWREDSSNHHRRFSRNRLRHDLIPQLKSEWNPRLDSVLSHSAAVAQEEEAYWAQEVARVLPSLLLSQRPAEVILDAGALFLYPPALRRRLLRAVAPSADFNHIEDFLALLRRGSGSIQLPNLHARLSFGRLRIARPAPRQPLNFTLEVPAEVSFANRRIVLEREGYNGGESLGVSLDWEKLSDPLQLRDWRPGDAYQPVGYGSVHKLHDLFQRARVPYWDRAVWPIMLSEDRIVWASRFGPAAQVAPGAATRSVLTIREVFTGE